MKDEAEGAWDYLQQPPMELSRGIERKSQKTAETLSSLIATVEHNSMWGYCVLALKCIGYIHMYRDTNLHRNQCNTENHTTFLYRFDVENCGVVLTVALFFLFVPLHAHLSVFSIPMSIIHTHTTLF